MIQKNFIFAKNFTMPSVPVRSRVIGKIKSMKDENLLIEIEEMIDHLSNKNQVYTLSDDMKSSVTSAEKDIKNGNVFSEAESTYHFKQWFEKR